MNNNKFYLMASSVVKKYNSIIGSKYTDKYNILDPIFSERLYNLFRYSRLNGEKENRYGILSWPGKCEKYGSEMKSIRVSQENSLKSIDINRPIIIPIKTTSNACLNILNNKLKKNKIDGNEMAHWVVAIVYAPEKRIRFMDSLNSGHIMYAWKRILLTFVNNLDFFGKKISQLKTTRTNFRFKHFGMDTRHQGASTNCAFFCILYMILTIREFSVEEIEKWEKCNEGYIEKELKPHLNKHIKM